MSRYLQQLARHAGLAPSGPVEARMASPVAPAPQNDITEEIVERDAVSAAPEASAPPEASAASTASPNLPEPFTVHLPAEKNLTAAQPPQARSATAELEKNSTTTNPAPATRKIAATESKPADRARRSTAPARPVSPDATTVIHQVIAWVAEPEQHARAAMPADQLAEKSTTAAAPGSAPAAVRLRKEDAPSDFHVSIGSIHLTVEAPPPLQPPAARPPRPTPAPTAPVRSGGLPTRARRHYVRSFT